MGQVLPERPIEKKVFEAELVQIFFWEEGSELMRFLELLMAKQILVQRAGLLLHAQMELEYINSVQEGCDLFQIDLVAHLKKKKIHSWPWLDQRIKRQ